MNFLFRMLFGGSKKRMNYNMKKRPKIFAYAIPGCVIVFCLFVLFTSMDELRADFAEIADNAVYLDEPVSMPENEGRPIVYVTHSTGKNAEEADRRTFKELPISSDTDGISAEGTVTVIGIQHGDKLVFDDVVLVQYYDGALTKDEFADKWITERENERREWVGIVTAAMIISVILMAVIKVLAVILKIVF